MCALEKPGPCAFVIFGASGDLARRKLVPSLYHLYAGSHLPDSFLVFGTANTEMDEDAFRTQMEAAVRDAYPDRFDDERWRKFRERLYYMPGSFGDAGFMTALDARLRPLEVRHKTEGNRIYHMAIPPDAYATVVNGLGASGLSKEDRGYSRIVAEKPFGSDLISSRKLNETLKEAFSERQIYRMDHYLAKENVQNSLMFRFANSIFEPLWNRRYIDHVQITISETLGVEHRAGYYEKAGVLRDMFQNHILQLLALTAMEPPAVFMSESVVAEKAKVLRSIRPVPPESSGDYIALGQYGKGRQDGADVPGYKNEPGVAPGSMTPTYAAMKLHIDNWRWSGVPFYLRSGKRLTVPKCEIAITYKPVPHLIFPDFGGVGIDPNVLVMRVQPDEGISLTFQTKTPESRTCLAPVIMDFKYEKVYLLEAYERVLLDCMLGDQMLFVSAEIEDITWSFMTPLIEKLETVALQPEEYPAGSAGPIGADALIDREGRNWRKL